MTGHDHLRPVVADAVARYPYETDEAVFRLRGYQDALQDAFDLRQPPGSENCRAALARLPFVKGVGDGYHFVYQPEAEVSPLVPDRGADSIRDHA